MIMIDNRHGDIRIVWRHLYSYEKSYDDHRKVWWHGQSSLIITENEFLFDTLRSYTQQDQLH